MTARPIVSQAEFARLRGVSRTTGLSSCQAVKGSCCSAPWLHGASRARTAPPALLPITGVIGIYVSIQIDMASFVGSPQCSDMSGIGRQAEVTSANMRFVATKTPEQKSCLTLHRTRHLFIRQQT